MTVDSTATIESAEAADEVVVERTVASNEGLKTETRKVREAWSYLTSDFDLIHFFRTFVQLSWLPSFSKAKTRRSDSAIHNTDVKEDEKRFKKVSKNMAIACLPPSKLGLAD